MTTTILALDLGTTTGWALRGSDGHITSGILILQQLARRQPVKNRSRLLRSEDHTAAGRCQLKQIIKIFCLI